MSDPKRGTLITVGATKSAKNIVTKTVRLFINLDESNESKYPELNYTELVKTEERKKREKIENGKTSGLDPFSDNNDDVERIARKFEQKYGGKSTYGRKGDSKQDDFADIGAGYDENDSFIDNTHGYDEMIPPECDTFYGGFYINCGSLEFKNVLENQLTMSETEPGESRRLKRPASSNTSEVESSESSSDSESQGEKDPKAITNGDIDSHNTEHRKKKNKKTDKKKPKKVLRTDSSAATSGKQTSDDNAHGEGESTDSRTSQSDSLTSKPAPSSENPVTSDSSRDVEAKVELKLPASVVEALEALEVHTSKQLAETSGLTSKELISNSDDIIQRVSVALSSNKCSTRVWRAAWTRAARALWTSRDKLLRAVKNRADPIARSSASQPSIAETTSTTAINTVTTPLVTSTTSAVMSTSLVTSTSVVRAITSIPTSTTSTTTVSSTTNNKRKHEDDLDDFDPERLSYEQREAIIIQTLKRLSALIEERKPGMIANYNAECERVQEERKKIQIAMAEGAAPVEKRLPKRRFPWCTRSRALVCRLVRAAGSHEAAVVLLQGRVLPLFPPGFVRMPTLLRQADLSKEIKVSDLKRQRLGSASQPTPTLPPMTFTEPIQFPSSLTVTATTTTKQSQDKTEVAVSSEDKFKTNPGFGSILNTYTLNKDLIIDKPEKKDTFEKKDEPYIPPNNIGSITITPVPSNPVKPDKKPMNNIPNQSTERQTAGFIRVKSPAALNDMVKKDKIKKTEKLKEKRVASPLHVDTSFVPNKKDPSPKRKEEIPQKTIEHMRVAENNIPRPTLVPVHHSPTFAKPDKRPPDMKKKKDVLITSDVDPLSDQQEPLSVDDSSSDVELVEDVSSKSDKNEQKRDKNETVPCKERVIVNVDKKVINKCRKEKETAKSENEEPTKEEFDTVIRDLKELGDSQERKSDKAKFNSNSYGGVITNDQASLNKMDGCKDNVDEVSHS